MQSFFLSEGVIPPELDACDSAGKPVAKIALPQRVPVGFDGNRIRA